MSGIRLQLHTSRLSEGDFEDLCERVLEYCVEISPVDTGYFASNWELSVEYPEAEISNGTPYGEYLDDGSSDQAPDGITGPAAAYAERIASEY